jgi:hypothetical protein
MGPGSDYNSNTETAPDVAEIQNNVQVPSNKDKVHVVWNLPFDYFRSKLIEHFNTNQVVWPVQNKIAHQ